MFRLSPFYHRLISLSLPVIFVWAWAACLLFCAETVAHGENAGVKIESEIGCFDSHCLEQCEVRTIPAAFQERQTVFAAAIFTASETFSPFQFQAIVPKVFASDIFLHAPPKIVFPRFLRHQNLRI
jgi:hypothetical protein